MGPSVLLTGLMGKVWALGVHPSSVLSIRIGLVEVCEQLLISLESGGIGNSSQAIGVEYTTESSAVFHNNSPFFQQ